MNLGESGQSVISEFAVARVLGPYPTASKDRDVVLSTFDLVEYSIDHKQMKRRSARDMNEEDTDWSPRESKRTRGRTVNHRVDSPTASVSDISHAPVTEAYEEQQLEHHPQGMIFPNDSDNIRGHVSLYDYFWKLNSNHYGRIHQAKPMTSAGRQKKQKDIPQINLQLQRLLLEIDPDKLVPQCLIEKVDLKQIDVHEVVDVHVNNWIKQTLDESDFIQQISMIVNVVYPRSFPSILDEILVSFLIRRPERIDMLMVKLLDRLISRSNEIQLEKQPLIQSFVRAFEVLSLSCSSPYTKKKPVRTFSSPRTSNQYASNEWSHRYHIPYVLILQQLVEKNDQLYQSNRATSTDWLFSYWISEILQHCSNKIIQVVVDQFLDINRVYSSPNSDGNTTQKWKIKHNVQHLLQLCQKESENRLDLQKWQPLLFTECIIITIFQESFELIKKKETKQVRLILENSYPVLEYYFSKISHHSSASTRDMFIDLGYHRHYSMGCFREICEILLVPFPNSKRNWLALHLFQPCMVEFIAFYRSSAAATEKCDYMKFIRRIIECALFCKEGLLNDADLLSDATKNCNNPSIFESCFRTLNNTINADTEDIVIELIENWKLAWLDNSSFEPEHTFDLFKAFLFETTLPSCSSEGNTVAIAAARIKSFVESLFFKVLAKRGQDINCYVDFLLNLVYIGGTTTAKVHVADLFDQFCTFMVDHSNTHQWISDFQRFFRSSFVKILIKDSTRLLLNPPPQEQHNRTKAEGAAGAVETKSVVRLLKFCVFMLEKKYAERHEKTEEGAPKVIRKILLQEQIFQMLSHLLLRSSHISVCVSVIDLLQHLLPHNEREALIWTTPTTSICQDLSQLLFTESSYRGHAKYHQAIFTLCNSEPMLSNAFLSPVLLQSMIQGFSNLNAVQSKYMKIIHRCTDLVMSIIKHNGRLLDQAVGCVHAHLIQEGTSGVHFPSLFLWCRLLSMDECRTCDIGLVQLVLSIEDKHERDTETQMIRECQMFIVQLILQNGTESQLNQLEPALMQWKHAVFENKNNYDCHVHSIVEALFHSRTRLFNDA